MMKVIVVLILTSGIAWSFSPVLRLPVQRSRPKTMFNLESLAQAPSRYHYLPLCNSNRFALDKSVLPSIYVQPTRGVGIAVLGCALLCMLWALVQSNGVVAGEWLTEFVRSRQAMANYSVVNKLKEVFVDLITNMRSLQERVLTRFSWKPRDSFSLGNWNVCTLARIEPAGEEYNLYRFQLPTHPATSVKVDIGQEVQCACPLPCTTTFHADYFLPCRSFCR